MSDGITWLVRRFHWRNLKKGPEPRYVRLPGASTVAEFDNREDAEANRRQREQSVRNVINPFRCGFDLADCTHIPDYAFKDFLMDDSVRPAKYDSTAQIRWDKWWEKHSPDWNFDRRGRIWEALDKVRFFEVVSREAERQLFVAVEGISDLQMGPLWDRWRYVASEFGTEGGRPVRAFRTRDDAVTHLELVAETTNRSDGMQPDTDPFTDPERLDRLPADRVYDVPLNGEFSADLHSVFVVCRVGFAPHLGDHRRVAYFEIDAYRTGEERLADGDDSFDAFPSHYPVRRPRLVPEAAFAQLEDAEDNAQLRERAARRLLNPYLIYELRGRARGNLERLARDWAASFANAPDEVLDNELGSSQCELLYHVVEIELDD